MDLENLKYPIGRFKKPEIITADDINKYISEIRTLPAKLRKAVQNLSDEDLNLTYRPDGWNIRQLVHHLADSHMNAFIRFKLAITEDGPSIKPYFEGRWAELADSKSMPVEGALQMIEGIHARWMYLAENFTKEDWQRTFFHPESKRYNRLDDTLCLYAWHGKHHFMHIRNALESR